MDLITSVRNLIDEMTLLCSDGLPLNNMEKHNKLMELVKEFLNLINMSNSNIAIKHEISQIILQFILTLINKGDPKPIEEKIYRSYVNIHNGVDNEEYLSVKGYALSFNFNDGKIKINFKTDKDSLNKKSSYPFIEDGAIYYDPVTPNKIRFESNNQSYISQYDENGIEVSRLLSFDDESNKINVNIYREKSDLTFDSSLVNIVLHDKNRFTSLTTYAAALGNPQQKYSHELNFDLKCLKDILNKKTNAVIILPDTQEKLFPTPFSQKIEDSVKHAFITDEIKMTL